MTRRQSSGRRFLLIALVAVGLLAPAIPAQTFDIGGGCYSSLHYDLQGDPEFDRPNYTSNIVGGFTAWKLQVDRYSGADGFSVQAGSSPDVSWTDFGGWINDSMKLGEANCFWGTIKFNDHPDAIALFDSNILKLRGTAAHEGGHILALDHAGDDDSHDGQKATMATCTDSSAKGSLEQDDEAAVQARTDASGVYVSVTANSSFEEASGWQYWGKQSVSSSGIYSGGVDSTPYYASFKGSSSSTAVYSTTRLMNARTIDWIKGRANYRKSYVYDYGHVLVVMKWRNVNYVNGETCGSPDYYGASGVEQTINDVSSVGSFNDHYYTKTCYPGSSWGYCTTSGAAPGNVDAIDARIVVYNRMRAPQGNYTWVGVDRIRALVDY